MKKSLRTTRKKARAPSGKANPSKTKARLIQDMEELSRRLERLERSNKRLKSQQARLKENEERYHSLFSGSQAPMLLIDPEHQLIVDANNAACNFYGYDRHTLVGMSMSRINTLSEEDIRRNMARARKKKKNHLVFLHRLASGRKKDVEVYANPVTIGGKPYMYAVIHDITSRRHAEKALEKVHESLESKVAERTLELFDANISLEAEVEERKCIEEELRNNRKSLEEALGEKDLLIKEIHHRTKNNLAIVQSMLKLQSRQISDRTAQAMFNESLYRLQALSMVHERLYRSRDFRSVDFAEYVRSLVAALVGSQQVNRNNLNIHIQVEKASLDVNSVIPCGLIINELVTNCIKHAFPEGRRGEIIVMFSKRPGGECSLEVRDNGVGLPESFDPSTLDSFGIEIIRSLAQQIGGTFEIGSGDKGTTARLRFREQKDEDTETS